LEGGEEAPEEEAEEPEAEENGEEGAVKKPKKVLFSEAHRLTYAVSQIEADCGLVPKGAFVVNATHHVVADPLFIGLSGTEAGSLNSYFHFRAAQHPARRTALKSAAVLGTGDFMDPASEDEPKGVVWSLRVDAAKGQVNIRSFKWPGYFFWHQIASPYFAAVYFGDGSVNKDLGFMA
jgi:radial spoke head protein 9